jgi:1-acyl-sn-glycerol-3-phosphate acyltransferase
VAAGAWPATDRRRCGGSSTAGTGAGVTATAFVPAYGSGTAAWSAWRAASALARAADCHEDRSVLYALVAFVLRPAFRWGRMRVEGLELLPASGPVLIVPNHDSQWDPVALAVATIRVRRLRFLARANLWEIPGVRLLMRSSRQIPIERGAGDRNALVHAVEALRAGDAVVIFPEGKLSEGQRLRARSGVGYLVRECPEVPVLLAAVAGCTDMVRFPRRPRVDMTFFEPAGGQPRADEEPAELAARLLGELRDRVPPAPAGRRPRARLAEAG